MQLSSSHQQPHNICCLSHPVMEHVATPPLQQLEMPLYFLHLYYLVLNAYKFQSVHHLADACGSSIIAHLRDQSTILSDSWYILCFCFAHLSLEIFSIQTYTNLLLYWGEIFERIIKKGKWHFLSYNTSVFAFLVLLLANLRY